MVGIGGDSPYSDTTALALPIKSPQGKVYDVAADFSTKVESERALVVRLGGPGRKARSGNVHAFCFVGRRAAESRSAA